MAKRTIEWESKGADRAAKDAKNIAKSQDSVDKSAGKLAKTVAGVTIAYRLLKEALVESSKVYAEVDAVQGRIRRNFRQMGMTARQAEREMAAQNKTFRENIRFGLKISEQTNAYNELLDVTKDVTAAREDLALATDIQADKDVDLAGAGEVLGQVRNGNIRGLQKLGVLTKDQVRDLNSLKDESERTAAAMDILRQEFAGAAEENAGHADTLAANEANYERLQIAIGSVVTELGDQGAGFIGRTLDAITASEDGTFTVNNFAGAFENFADTIPRATENIGHFLDELRAEDIPTLASNLGVLTESGRTEIQKIAGRGRAKAKQGGGGGGGGGEEGGGGGASDGFVGPELTAEMRIRIAQDKEKAESTKKLRKVEDDAEDAAWERLVRQRARWEQERMEQELAAQKAEEVADREAAAAERAAERKAAAEKKRQEDIAAADKRMAAEEKKRKKEQKKLDDEATKATIDNAEMAATGALGFAEDVVKGEAAKNVVKGGTHLAEAAGAVARGVTTQDPTQFIGAGLHVAAAVKHFAQASSAGGAGGVPSKGAAGAGGGSASAAGGGGGSSVPSSTRRDVDLAGGGQSGGGGGTNLYLTFGSIWPPTPQQVKDTARLMTGAEGGEM